MDALTALMTRTSIGALREPAPDQSALERAFAAALRAPDHRQLRPWRFITIGQGQRAALGELFAHATSMVQPDIVPAELQRVAQMPMRAPMIVVAAAHAVDDPKVPASEQVMATAAAVQNFLLALHAQGYAGMWRSGPLADNPHVKTGLGLEAGDVLLGFIYVGTPAASKPIVPLATADFVRNWAP